MQTRRGAAERAAMAGRRKSPPDGEQTESQVAPPRLPDALGLAQPHYAARKRRTPPTQPLNAACGHRAGQPTPPAGTRLRQALRAATSADRLAHSPQHLE